MLLTQTKRYPAPCLPPSRMPILTSDERGGDEGPSMAALIRQAEAAREDRRRQRVEVSATVELCLRVNLSMVVYGE